MRKYNPSLESVDIILNWVFVYLISRTTIARSDWFSSVISIFKRARCASVDSIISYGIGSIEDSVRSQIQTAFLLVLADSLQVHPTQEFSIEHSQAIELI